MKALGIVPDAIAWAAYRDYGLGLLDGKGLRDFAARVRAASGAV
mgnify:CR=1 FL=1